MNNKNNILEQGATIGIIGAGQLGKMLALSAYQLGFKVAIFCPDKDGPAFDVTPLQFIASYDDKDSLKNFANHCDIITYEFENLPLNSIKFLEKIKPLAPSSFALSITQDRLKEKQFLASKNIKVAKYQRIENLTDLQKAKDNIGLPLVLKTTRMGYDGKGQRIIREEREIEKYFNQLSGSVLIAEQFIPFVCEISIIIARNKRGQVREYDVSENLHENHILKTSIVPANISPLSAKKATRIAHEIVGALDYVGVMGIEFFVVNQDGDEILIVNEIAPRVHNSGHWTKAVCAINQFEQHIRAIANWPLGDPTRFADVRMENLLGKEIIDAHKKLQSGTNADFYGKTEIRSGRKMGHLNHIQFAKNNI